MNSQQFSLGEYRPIYLWAGPGTVRMNRVKFMDQDVDVISHQEAHQAVGADRIVDCVYSNWIHLMYDWGFPPEIEQEDWKSFQEAVKIYHARNAKVFAYIQSSNCVYQGSFRDQTWYAEDARGRKIHYYTQRYMTNMLDPDWQNHLRDMIRGAIEGGADGIFFDNLWFGAMPNSFLGGWLGEAGYFNKSVQDLYRKERGGKIPFDVNENSPQVRDYLKWRSEKLTQIVADLVRYAKSLKPDVVISANDYDVVMRDSFLIYGIDMEALAEIQDVTMIENFSMPKWETGQKDRLTNNAITLRVAREWVADKAALSILSYDAGIGFDGMYSARRFQQTITEAAACGVSNTIKGTEYYEKNQHTMLNSADFIGQQEAIGQYQRWLEENRHQYSNDRKNLSQVVLMLPEEALRFEWQKTAPVFFGVAQVLTHAGIPWKVQHGSDFDLEAGKIVFGFTEEHRQRGSATGIKYVHVPDLAGWGNQIKSFFLMRNSVGRKLIYSLTKPLLEGYFSSKFIRRWIDRLKLFRLVIDCPYYIVPEESKRERILNEIPAQFIAIEDSEYPVLVEVWDCEGAMQVHLMNYGDTEQWVKINFQEHVRGKILSPDNELMEFDGQDLKFELDIYAILIIESEQ